VIVAVVVAVLALALVDEPRSLLRALRRRS
jgi:hypothetical protein